MCRLWDEVRLINHNTAQKGASVGWSDRQLITYSVNSFFGRLSPLDNESQETTNCLHLSLACMHRCFRQYDTSLSGL